MQILQSLKSKLVSIPRWRLCLYGALFLFAVVYLAWCRWGTKPIKPGQIVAAKTSPKVADMERKVVHPQKLMVVHPKAEAVRRLQLPKEEAANAQEEVFEATDAPASKYGTTTITFANLSTGMPRTVIKAKEAPWFRFERGNEIGVEGGIGTRGKYSQIDYQRDILSVKGVVMSGKASGIYTPDAREDKGEFRIGVRVKYQW